MILSYEGKKTEKEILGRILPVRFSADWDDRANKLIEGENAGVLKNLLDLQGLRSKVDLVYIDPPFATGQKFTIGRERANSISRSSDHKTAFRDRLTGAGYLEFLRERLVLIRELMADSASIYLHIDYKIGHYVKIIMDEIFGAANFRNDITRVKCNPKNFRRKGYGNVKDLILFYSKGRDPVWNEPREEFSEEDIERLFRKTDEDGRRYTTIPLHAPGETKNGATGGKWRGMSPPKGRHWRSAPDVLEQLDRDGLVEWSKTGVPRRKIYADERKGKKKQDIWEFKDAQYPSYPTEKNIDLLRTLIAASSNPGDLVLDCFCGSGTTLQAAAESKRRWIGVDRSPEAIKTARKRLAGMAEFQYLERPVL
ncbi:MAG: site-specific DNA-methyltransferase [Pyrinomonadaceae bacterium]